MDALYGSGDLKSQLVFCNDDVLRLSKVIQNSEKDLENGFEESIITY
ncbi:MAG: hypothetical protein IPJ69_04630 [Deltaproteobacteria bacterium]|nr:MAG: hypothetical protein IPJ69_04630 [Deltaproteobacteria bacterium]